MSSLPFRNFWQYPWERLALFFFILTLPFSMRNILWSFSPTGTFNEYTDISIYLSDISLAVLILLIFFKHGNAKKSSSMFHVEHWYFFLPFLLWVLATMLWAESKVLAGYAGIKILEGYFLFLALIYLRSSDNLYRRPFMNEGKSRFQFFISKCSTWNIYRWIFGAIIISGLLQGIIGLLQFLHQKSIGLHAFGESILSKDLPGVAKVILGNETAIRAYGMFPHPNILGGFLALTLFLSLLYPLITHNKMFHVEHNLLRFFLKIAIIVQFLALLSTFSKSAIIGFTLAFIFFISRARKMFHVEQTSKNVPRGTFLEKVKMFHVEHLLIPIAILLLIIAIFQWINPYFWLLQSVEERLFLYKSLLKFPLHEIFFGLGAGQYVLLMQQFYPHALELWQFQPLHNLFLLIITELGVVGLSLFLLLIFGCFFKVSASVFHVEQTSKNVPRGTFLEQTFLISLLILLIFPALFDHYWWDIQQGQLLFWFILGLGYIIKKD